MVIKDGERNRVGGWYGDQKRLAAAIQRSLARQGLSVLDGGNAFANLAELTVADQSTFPAEGFGKGLGTAQTTAQRSNGPFALQRF